MPDVNDAKNPSSPSSPTAASAGAKPIPNGAAPAGSTPSSDYKNQLEKESGSLLTAINKYNNTIHRFAELKQFNENHLAHAYFGYSTSPLAQKINALRDSLLETAKEDQKPSINLGIAKLQSELQIQHIEMMKGKDVSSNLYAILNTAKKEMSLDDKAIGDLKDKVIKEHMNDQAKKIKETNDTFFSAFWLLKADPLNRFKRAGATHSANDTPTITEGQLSYYKKDFLQTGSYKKEGSKNTILIDKLKEGLNARINIKDTDPKSLKEAYGEAMELLMANGAEKIILSFSDEQHVNYDNVLLMIQAAADRGIGIELDNKIHSAVKLDAPNSDYRSNKKYQQVLDAFNACNALAQQKEQKADDKRKEKNKELEKESPKSIIKNENKKSIEAETKKITALSKEKPIDVKAQKDPDKIAQITKDKGTLADLKKTLQEIERQQWLMDYEYKKALDAKDDKAAKEIQDDAKPIQHLNFELEKAIRAIETRLLNYSQDPNSNEVKAEANAAMDNDMKPLFNKVREIRAGLSDQQLGRELSSPPNAAAGLAPAKPGDAATPASPDADIPAPPDTPDAGSSLRAGPGG